MLPTGIFLVPTKSNTGVQYRIAYFFHGSCNRLTVTHLDECYNGDERLISSLRILQLVTMRDRISRTMYVALTDMFIASSRTKMWGVEGCVTL